MFVCTVILFNHESPLRPLSFVTRKITDGVARVAAGEQDFVELGNLKVRRDWGSARDYVRAMQLALAVDGPGDYCIASGESHGLGEFVELAFSSAGISDPWRHVQVNPALARPTDIPETRGDPTRAKEVLGWSRSARLEDVVGEMVRVDVERHRSGLEHRRSYVDPAAAV